jgi:streptogramin lyase
MPIVVALVVTGLALWTTAAFLKSVASERGRAAGSAPLAAPTRIVGRILFVSREDTDLVLDCVAASGHPARSQVAPGIPFSVRVSAFGSTWFADSMQGFLERLARENRIAAFELATGPDGDRLDVSSEATRMRFDFRSGAGLS